uniref:Uncharacterized protein n=1 Tax=Timema douglasi TaxID=61478 RepID=A0A7R8VDG2_TIMDO|nr:unnamed protein product [Timema douglasi]
MIAAMYPPTSPYDQRPAYSSRALRCLAVVTLNLKKGMKLINHGSSRDVVSREERIVPQGNTLCEEHSVSRSLVVGVEPSPNSRRNDKELQIGHRPANAVKDEKVPLVSWEPYFCVLLQDEQTLTAYRSEELSIFPGTPCRPRSHIKVGTARTNITA